MISISKRSAFSLILVILLLIPQPARPMYVAQSNNHTGEYLTYALTAAAIFSGLFVTYKVADWLFTETKEQLIENAKKCLKEVPKYDEAIKYLSEASDSQFSFEALGIKEVTRKAVQEYLVELSSYICALEKNIQGMSKIDYKEAQENKLQLDSAQYLASLIILHERTDKKYYSDYISGACIII